MTDTKTPTPELQEKIERLEALRERVRAATGPDREIDADIHCAFNPERMTHPKAPRGFTFVNLNDDAKNRNRAISKFITHNRGPSPNYTASIDAALRLVEKVLPPNSWISIENACMSLRYPWWQINIHCEFCLAKNKNRSTAPLAILDALLTAMIEQERQ